MSALTVEDLHAGYGGTQVLHGIDLAVPEAGVTVLLGANGVGKTTTLRAISGLLPRRGRVLLDGRDVTTASPAALSRAGLAHVPQGRGTMLELTVEENLRAGGYRRSRRDVDVEIERWFDTFPQLRVRSRQRAGNLSGGEQQMLAIARAFMTAPSLVLLDEPSLGLSPVAVAEVFTVLDAVRAESGTAVLLVEQNAELAIERADRGYVLAAGQVVLDGTAEDLRRDDAIRRAYLGGAAA